MRLKQLVPGLLLSAAFAVGVVSALQAAEWNAGAGKDWEDLLAAARKEGQVTVSVCPGGMVDTIGKMFKEDTGINISFVTGTLPELGARFDTEMQTGRVTIDVRVSGSSAVAYAKQGVLAPVRDRLLLPGVTDGANWLGGRLGWLDSTERYNPFGGQYVGGRVVVNTDLIDPKSITTWKDLLKPEYKGKIGAIDPTVQPGTTTSEYLVDLYGLDFISQLYKGQNVALTRDRRQVVEWVARGTYPIVVGADAAPEMETFQQAGVTSLRVLTFTDGPGNLIGGCTVTSVPSKAPHPNAATVFLNWFLSKRGQEAFVAGQRQPSNRLDVAQTGVQPNLIPQPGLEYFSTFRENYVLVEQPAIQAAIAKAMAK
jgi:ABC-type Fe3+ transport system substrate-binding protein